MMIAFELMGIAFLEFRIWEVVVVKLVVAYRFLFCEKISISLANLGRIISLF